MSVCSLKTKPNFKFLFRHVLQLKRFPLATSPHFPRVPRPLLLLDPVPRGPRAPAAWLVVCLSIWCTEKAGMSDPPTHARNPTQRSGSSQRTGNNSPASFTNPGASRHNTQSWRADGMGPPRPAPGSADTKWPLLL